MSSLSEEFFAVTATLGSAEDTSDAEREHLDTAIAFFMRYHLDELQRPKAKKTAILKKIDELARSIIQWSPTAKLPAEYLLLRSEDENTRAFTARCSMKPLRIVSTDAVYCIFPAVTTEEAHEIAAALASAHARSPMALIFQGVTHFDRNDLDQVCEHNRLQMYCSSRIANTHVLNDVGILWVT